MLYLLNSTNTDFFVNDGKKYSGNGKEDIDRQRNELVSW